jgi:polyisoprenyl-teichoic acid--peptidoglycan teichoic acid transferase
MSFSRFENTELRKNKKKKRVNRFLASSFLISILLILAVSSHILIQYQTGRSSGESALSNEEIEFNGADVNSDLKIANVLLLGVDARGDQSSSRTDTIMLAQHNLETGQSKLVSIMRDSYVKIPQHGYNKINAAYAFGGPELLRKTIKNNFDIDVQYYAIIDFNGFIEVIDEIFPKGVEVNVEKAMSEGINPPLSTGLQNLNGDQLLSYARFRKDIESDFGRVRRQQEVLQSLVNEYKDINGLLKIPKTIGLMQNYVKTNIKKEILLSLATSTITEGSKNVETLRIPNDNTFTNERYSGIGAVLELDMEENRKLIHDFLK